MTEKLRMAKARLRPSPIVDRIVAVIQERARLWRTQEMTELREGRIAASELSHAKAVACEELLIKITRERETERG